MEKCPSPAYTQNAVAYALSLLFWIACFYGCWFFFPQWGKTRERWATMNASERYGLCGLLYSTLHGTIVPIGIVICMTDCGIWGNWLADTCTQMEVVSSLHTATKILHNSRYGPGCGTLSCYLHAASCEISLTEGQYRTRPSRCSHSQRPTSRWIPY